MFTDNELNFIESLANNKLIELEDTIKRNKNGSTVLAYALDQKPVIESILEKVRKM